MNRVLYLVFVLLKSNGSNWIFKSAHPTPDAAEQESLRVMRIYGNDVNVIRVMQHIFEGKPETTSTVVWK